MGVVGICLSLVACEGEENDGDGLLLSLVDYLPQVVGDSLWYQSATDSERVFIAFPDAQLVVGDSLPVLRRVHSRAEDRVQQFRRDKGRYLYQYEEGNRAIVFTEPVRMLPAWMVVGDTHTVAMDYAVVEGEVVRGNGRATFMTILEGIKPVETPLRTFAESVVLRTEMVRTDDSGAEAGYRIREWYAERVGLVKEEGTAFSTDEAGGRTSTTFNHALAQTKITRDLAF